MLEMRKLLAPTMRPQLLARDRLQKTPRPRPEAGKSRPLPRKAGKCKALLMLRRMRPMLAQLKPKKRRPCPTIR
ncbi:hypothetical protein [Mesorhizobium sp. Z1-4]|uniref:hypothetical protein n=1 Tax=Mesorhizobium sp. Z1-4 TaxID=2448478 RepID=UPI000FDBDB4D|nr:hypothetical protein [Mesorhizobium sp. Z1-4]